MDVFFSDKSIEPVVVLSTEEERERRKERRREQAREEGREGGREGGRERNKRDNMTVCVYIITGPRKCRSSIRRPT